MRRQHVPWTLTCAVLVGGLISGPARTSRADDDHQRRSPLAESKAQRHPDGSRIAQEYIKPVAGAEDANIAAAVADDLTGPAGVSALVGRRPAIRNLQPVAQYSTRVGVAKSAPQPAAEATTTLGISALVGPQAVALGGQPSDDRKKTVTSFALQYRGIPLSKFSSSMALVRDDGTVLLVRERNIPRQGEMQTEPTVERRTAQDLGRDDALTVDGLKADDITVGPASPEIWVDKGRDGQLTWTFVVRSKERPYSFVRQYWVAARGDAKILYSEDQVFHAHHGKVSATLFPARTSPFGTAKDDVPLPFAQVRLGAAGATTVTGADGTFTLPGSGTAQVRADLTGTFCRIQNAQGTVMSRTATSNGTDTVPLNFAASGQQELAQTTAFFWTNVAAVFTQDVLGLGANHRLARLRTLVNRNDFVPNVGDSCNAFWDGSSLNFFMAGGGCPNTVYSDVVLHEYGHGVDARLGTIMDAGYSEGFGDSLSILVLRDPIVGRDFFGPGQHLRVATDVVNLPDTQGRDPHFVGRVYGGFAWELTQRLKAKFSGDEDRAFDVAKDLILGAAAMNPSDTSDAVFLSFVVDDDDGDLSNGSPHFDELAGAADARDIPRPDFSGASPINGNGAGRRRESAAEKSKSSK